MAASEAPEPPPRNTEKINASVKQSNETKLEKKLDVDDRKSSSQSTDSSEEKSNSSKNSPNSEQKTVSKATTPNDTKSDSTEKSERAEKKYDSNNSAIEAANDAKKDGENDRLNLENVRLTNEVARLKSLLQDSSDGAVGGVELPSEEESTHEERGPKDAKRLEFELRVAKEQISNLKSERRKLRSEKTDLLAHVKQLCASLQEKEKELRDFIRNYELRTRENESSSAKTERDRERWSLLKHAREESERSIALATQLNARELQLKRAQEQLRETRRQLASCMSDQESLASFAAMNQFTGNSTGNTIGYATGLMADRESCSADSGVRGSSDRESTAGDFNLSDAGIDNGPCITIDSDSISLTSSHYMNQYGTPKDCSPTLSPLNAAAFARSIDGGGILSRSVEQIGTVIESDAGAMVSQYQQPVIQRRVIKSGTSTLGGRGHRASGSHSTWGSISRVFTRNRNRSKQDASQYEHDESMAYQSRLSPLSSESYAEKLRLLREASSIPMECWRASQVSAWLEVALGMPQYSIRCAENIKSGKVLLELNDAELETGLGLTHPMHRKKIRLAIEELRRPEMMRYHSINQLGHIWVASEWLPDIGLPQYAEAFLHSLVDARMLDTLSKKELEKYLGVTRKFHQASLVHGIHVLRIMKYDRQALAMRRQQCENINVDPIVWTNQKFIRWAKSIDLGEYADNLKESGVHGGLVVLEPSFSGDTLATAMGIPTSKTIIRRHLCTEFDALILPVRATLRQGVRTGSGVVPLNNTHTMSSVDRRSSGSLRGSLSNVFRFNSSTASKSNRNSDGKPFGTSTSPTPSYSSPSSENGLYATVNIAGIYHPPSDGLSSPLQQPNNYRVSAPPLESNTSTLPRYSEHRRVKSINDIEIVSATPV